MAEIIDPKSVKLFVDGEPFPVVAAPLSWEGVEVYTPPSEPDPSEGAAASPRRSPSRWRPWTPTLALPWPDRKS